MTDDFRAWLFRRIDEMRRACNCPNAPLSGGPDPECPICRGSGLRPLPPPVRVPDDARGVE